MANPLREVFIRIRPDWTDYDREVRARTRVTVPPSYRAGGGVAAGGVAAGAAAGGMAAGVAGGRGAVTSFGRAPLMLAGRAPLMLEGRAQRMIGPGTALATIPRGGALVSSTIKIRAVDVVVDRLSKWKNLTEGAGKVLSDLGRMTRLIPGARMFMSALKFMGPVGLTAFAGAAVVRHGLGVHAATLAAAERGAARTAPKAFPATPLAALQEQAQREAETRAQMVAGPGTALYQAELERQKAARDRQRSGQGVVNQAFWADVGGRAKGMWGGIKAAARVSHYYTWGWVHQKALMGGVTPEEVAGGMAFQAESAARGFAVSSDPYSRAAIAAQARNPWLQPGFQRGQVGEGAGLAPGTTVVGTASQMSQQQINSQLAEILGILRVSGGVD